MKNSPIKANQELSSRLVIPEDWDDWEALTRKTLEKGTYAKLGNEITDREKSMGVWYQSKTTPWSTKYSGYVRDAFYKKNLLRRIHWSIQEGGWVKKHHIFTSLQRGHGFMERGDKIFLSHI